MACRTGCLSQDHGSWGECARAAAIQIDRHALASTSDARLEKRKDRTLARYRDMRRSGLQPEAPTRSAMDKVEAANG